VKLTLMMEKFAEAFRTLTPANRQQIIHGEVFARLRFAYPLASCCRLGQAEENTWRPHDLPLLWSSSEP